ncbi:MAG: STAS/SEC14 domain-containing protein [Acidimicrobiia bacterium]|nr:STAS/SEC14 domain-containing protein [Acidimicrobiia bacterium]
MIRPIDGLPDNVIGVEAVGEVRAGDYTTILDRAVDAALESHHKIRLLYVLGDDLDGYSGGAMWADTKIGMSHLSKWEKIAIVTDHKAYQDGKKGFESSWDSWRLSSVEG